VRQWVSSRLWTASAERVSPSGGICSGIVLTDITAVHAPGVRSDTAYEIILAVFVRRGGLAVASSAVAAVQAPRVHARSRHATMQGLILSGTGEVGRRGRSRLRASQVDSIASILAGSYEVVGRASALHSVAVPLSLANGGR